MSAEVIHHEQYDMPKLESMRDQLEFERLHNQDTLVDGGGFTIYDPGSIDLPRTGHFAVLSELHLVADGNADAALVRERHQGKDTFLIVGLSKNEHGNTVYNGYNIALEQGKELSVGRDPSVSQSLWDDAHAQVSRNHLTVSLFGDAIRVHDHSSNATDISKGTQLRSKSEDEHEVHLTGYTSNANLELMLLQEESRADVEERGGEVYVGGRVTIGRDTVINSERPGIDIRSWRVGGESIVVDSKKYPEQYTKLMNSYEKTLRKLSKGGLRRPNEEMKLRAVFDTVSQALNYNLNYVNAWEEIKAKEPKEDLRKIGLDVYLEAGEGVCRHMALAVGWLGGELARKGEISGRMTTGANYRKKDNSGHEWARYTAADGIVYILDPAQKHFGRLTDFMDDEKVWEYFRPGERAKYDALQGKGDIDPSNVVFKPNKIVPRIWK